MDPLSIFLNLLAKTDGRDKVLHSYKLVLATHPICNSQFQSQQGAFCCSIRSDQNDQESIEIFENFVILYQGTSINSLTQKTFGQS